MHRGLQALVFRPLCLIAHLDQELALELLGKTRQAVNEIELSRGTGTDISLRCDSCCLTSQDDTNYFVFGIV